MAETNVAETFKLFASKVTSPKVSERIGVLEKLESCIVSADLPEQAIRAVLKHLSLTLDRYQDRRSRLAVQRTVQLLAVHHTENCLKHALTRFTEVASTQKSMAACRSNSAAALNSLNFLCTIVLSTYKDAATMKGDIFEKMVALQAAFLSCAYAAQNGSISQGVLKRMFQIWRKVPGSVGVYIERFEKADPCLDWLCLAACVTKYLELTKDTDNMSRLRDSFVDVYIKHVLGGRTTPPEHIRKCCSVVLKHVTHSIFKESLLKAVDKAMLRNPEIVLPSVREMLCGVGIDLSAYAETLGRMLATHCHSNLDTSRAEACLAVKHLAVQISDSGAMAKLVTIFFDVLNGSEGKLGVVGQRMGMLTAIGHLSSHMVTGSSASQLSVQVIDLAVPFIKSEVHEGTLLLALHVLTQWTAKLVNKVPQSMNDWLKDVLVSKTCTSPVRLAYLHLCNLLYHRDTLHLAAPLVPSLLQCVQRAYAQPTQYGVVAEGLEAALLLAHISSSDDVTADVGSLWTLVGDASKVVFTSDKFVSQASTDSLTTLADLTYKMFSDNALQLSNEVARLYYRATLHAYTCAEYQARRHMKSCIQRLISVPGGYALSIVLLKEFNELLKAHKVIGEYEVRESSSEHDTAQAPIPVTPRVLTEVLMCITGLQGLTPNEAADVAMEALECCHHPVLLHYNIDLWTDLVGRLKLDCGQLVKDRLVQIISIIKDQLETSQPVSQALCSAIVTLTRIQPRLVLTPLMADLMTALDQPELVTVTWEEYGIMKTPEGELYDRTLLDSFQKETGSQKVGNVKRENKLYSYKEQLAEIELRQELENKKKKNTTDQPKLTKKQQELLDSQLEKEKAIRFKLKQLDGKLSSAFTLLDGCVRGNPASVRCFVPEVLDMIMPLMRSPLTAHRAASTFIALGIAAFTETPFSHLGPVLGHVTLRLLHPDAPLDHEWCQEDLSHQVQRTMTMISSAVLEGGHCFLATSFCYSLYFLQAVVESSSVSVELQHQALSVMIAHSRLRTKDERVDIDECGPELLPRHQLLRLSARVLSTRAGLLSQDASTLLVATAQAGCGDVGCAIATEREVAVLLECLEAPGLTTREVALQALQVLSEVVTPDYDGDPFYLLVIRRVWIAKFDVEEGNRILADEVWLSMALVLHDSVCVDIVDDVTHHTEAVRRAAADALAAAVKQHPDQLETVLVRLLELYQKKQYIPAPVVDGFNRVIQESPPDDWPSRSGVALALGRLGPALNNAKVEELFNFFVSTGLMDRSPDVQQTMREAAVEVLNLHGKDEVDILLPIFENFLAKAPNEAKFDVARQSVVVLMGSLAKHLGKDDERIKPIVAKLVQTLSTPSQSVQEAVANCLPPLVPAIKENSMKLVNTLLNLLLESPQYGERKGASYGIAGVVKGLGILSLKQLEIMSRLDEAIKDKKVQRHREGALFAFEMLCLMLGRLFEPYVVNILPNLLLCFGDSDQHVRKAADDCAKAIMSRLSAHGVKLVLPSLLKALEEDSWRTKAGSVELLGAMAYCAPKQLSACLPSIVPKILEVIADSHHKVHSAGVQALGQIGSVIKNPEIQAIVPVLLEALQDPSTSTTKALKCLLDTHFVHFIDAASLALIMPVVERAFQDRSTETRKMSAQIIGNMYSLTDQKDLAPYLPSVIPGLKQSLLDPVPEVRTVSAHALGAMVKGMGEAGFEELGPWLMDKLRSDVSTVDRSGAAQGLSEMVAALGKDKLNKLMPEIISTAERADVAPYVRDGYIMMFIYLPSVFGDNFMPYVQPTISPILKALADENEFVRDTALRAGRQVIDLYSEKAIELLLPALEQGLFDDNWRIRYSSIQLLGDLLYKISGVTGKMTTESSSEDDNFGTELSQQSIIKTLGEQRRNRVLAGLYMGRSDSALMVRQAALHVWKIIVTHTPKTLREILPTLFDLLLKCLASNSFDKRQVAASTLGDVVRKLGEKVLPEIIPILEKGLESNDSDQRQGVCIGLSEIMANTSKDHILVYADSLVPAVRRCLTDPLPEVRRAAATTFDTLHQNIGPRALEEIISDLLKNLDDNDKEQSEYALDGLRQVMSVKSRIVLPYLVPRLTSPPVNTRAVAFLSAVAGNALTVHLRKILPAVLKAAASKMGTEEEQSELAHCQTVVLAVSDEEGVRTIMIELLQYLLTDSTQSQKAAAAIVLYEYCENTKADLTEFLPVLFRNVMHLMIEDNEVILDAAWNCLNAVIKKLAPNELLRQISPLKQAIKFASSDLKPDQKLLPGFCLKKGVGPILPVFREGILTGDADQKEAASLGIGDLIRFSSPEALHKSLLNITGPLIRVLGDRFIYNVKIAVLDTLTVLLSKLGAHLKPFIPQLQTTFIKSLQDNNRAVRINSANALGELIEIQPKVDSIYDELGKGLKAATDNTIKETMLQALRRCIQGRGAKMSDKTRKDLCALFEHYLSAPEDSIRVTASACLGCLCGQMGEDELSYIMNLHFLDVDSGNDWVLRHARAVSLSICIRVMCEHIMMAPFKDKVIQAVLMYVSNDRVPVCLAGLRAVAYLLRFHVVRQQRLPEPLIASLQRAMKQESNDIKSVAAQVISYAVKGCPQQGRGLDMNDIKALIPMLVNGTKEKNTVVKTNSELALVTVLGMKDGEDYYQAILKNLSTGMSESLQELYKKALVKRAQMPGVYADDDIDDTQLS